MFGGMLVVFGCMSMCQYVIVCDSVCCLRCVVGCVSVGVDALALLCGVTVQKKNDICNSRNISRILTEMVDFFGGSVSWDTQPNSVESFNKASDPFFRTFLRLFIRLPVNLSLSE